MNDYWVWFREPSTAEGWAAGNPDGWWCGGLVKSQAEVLAKRHNEVLDKTKLWQ